MNESFIDKIVGTKPLITPILSKIFYLEYKVSLPHYARLLKLSLLNDYQLVDIDYQNEMISYKKRTNE